MERIANFFIIIGVLVFSISRLFYDLNLTSETAEYIIGAIALLIGITGVIIKKRNKN